MLTKSHKQELDCRLKLNISKEQLYTADTLNLPLAIQMTETIMAGSLYYIIIYLHSAFRLIPHAQVQYYDSLSETTISLSSCLDLIPGYFNRARA